MSSVSDETKRLQARLPDEDEVALSLPAGDARCPGPSIQDIIHRDGRPVPPVYAQVSYEFLGDQDIPYERYTSQDFFDREMELLWPRTWQWACRLEHIPHPGDYIVYEVGPYSFLVVRTPEGAVRAYFNSCLHRGTKLRPTGSEGNATDFRCPFHGWVYGLEGDLKQVPCPWDFPHVDPEEFSLAEVRVELWGGFVFINMDEEAPSLGEYMGVLPEHFSKWDLGERFVELHIEKELYCNWKAAIEAFLEGYHIFETHPQINKGSWANMQYDIFGDHVSRFLGAGGAQSVYLETQRSEEEIAHSLLVADSTVMDQGLTLKEGETARMALAKSLRKILGEKYQTDLSGLTDSELVDSAEYFLFPNMILFPNYAKPMIYRFRPLGSDPNRCLFEFLLLRPIPASGERPEPAQIVRIAELESFTAVPGMDPNFGHIYDQDTRNLRNQQEGFRASHKRGQTLGNYQEIRARHLHRAVDKYLFPQAG